MKETASRGGHLDALRKAPKFFIESVNRNREARGLEPLTIEGRANNDHRFSAKQREYNKLMEAKMAKPMTAVERVRDQAKRLAASKRKSKR